MSIRQYVVDAFADHLFEGNPAAVCVLDHYPSDELLQQITNENRLSETAFAVPERDGYRLRWFTPGGEIDLCGHATLATAFVLMNYYDTALDTVRFHTQSGELAVRKQDGRYEMDFPAYDLVHVPVTDDMEEALGVRPLEAWMGRDLLCVLDNEEQVRSLQPDFDKVESLDGLLCNVTAPGSSYDCVSRSFAPKCKVAEDPVCGSGHCHVIPYWAQRLGKTQLVARQASPRGGTLYCRMDGERVHIAGSAVLYSVAELNVEV